MFHVCLVIQFRLRVQAEVETITTAQTPVMNDIKIQTHDTRSFSVYV